MKTGDSSLGTDTTENSKLSDSDIAVIIKTHGKSPIPVLISLLPVMAMLIAILPCVIYRTTGIEAARLGIIILILTGITVFYIRINSKVILNKRFVKTVIILSYLSSISLMLFLPSPETFCFWMIGGLVTAMLVDIRLGLFFHFNLSLLMGIALPVTPEDFIQVLIMGVLMILLAGALSHKSMVIYASIIILSTDITIAFAIHNFVFPAADNYNYLNSFFCLIVIIAAAFIISLLYSRADRIPSKEIPATVSPREQDEAVIETVENSLELLGNDNETAAASNAVIDQNKEEEVPVSIQEIKEPEVLADTALLSETRTSYEVLCDLNNDLIRKMKQYSESLYTHSVRIGDLSYRAAIEIEADQMLALAGGLYHEIGKINGKNYIEEGLIIAEEYSFPKALRAVIREHNIKYEKPNSVEAAIVMLADSVESTIDYIVKNDDHKFTTDKIIDNIFQMRMEKGTFDTSGLTIKDFKLLKEFYQKEYRQVNK